MMSKAIKVIAVASALLLAGSWAAAGGDSQLEPIEQLGKELFFDKISEPAHSQSCATCHGAKVGWTGPVAGINLHGAVYRGAVPTRFGNRKPPTSAYSTFSPVFQFDMARGEFFGGMLWDGRATGNELGNPAADQALGPFLVDVEQNNPSKQAVCEHVASSRYADLFEEVWGPGSLDCGEGVDSTYDRFALSIAAYEGSSEVSPFNSKYDAYWASCLDAGNSPEECGLAEGEQSVLDPNGLLTHQEFDGLIEFGEYCSPCHVSHVPGPGGTPPLFTDFTYDNIGVPKNPENPFYDMDEELDDNGDPINPAGDAFIDLGLGGILMDHPNPMWQDLYEENLGKHKIPTVRNVDKRAGPGFPKAYMHNGFFKTLEDVVHFYNTRDVPEENWPAPEVSENVNRELFEGVPLGNLELDAEAEAAIVAFLGTLTDGRGGGGRGNASRNDAEVTAGERTTGLRDLEQSNAGHRGEVRSRKGRHPR
jgi:cytochrome c peroxidase